MCICFVVFRDISINFTNNSTLWFSTFCFQIVKNGIPRCVFLDMILVINFKINIRNSHFTISMTCDLLTPMSVKRSLIGLNFHEWKLSALCAIMH